MTTTACTDLAAVAPGTTRPAQRTVRFETEDVRGMIRAFLTWMDLGRQVASVSQID